MLLIQGCVNSFVKAEYDLGGIHDRRFAVLVAISVDLLLILFDFIGFDDRVVALAIVVSAKATSRRTART